MVDGWLIVGWCIRNMATLRCILSWRWHVRSTFVRVHSTYNTIKCFNEYALRSGLIIWYNVWHNDLYDWWRRKKGDPRLYNPQFQQIQVNHRKVGILNCVKPQKSGLSYSILSTLWNGMMLPNKKGIVNSSIKEQTNWFNPSYRAQSHFVPCGLSYGPHSSSSSSSFSSAATSSFTITSTLFP